MENKIGTRYASPIKQCYSCGDDFFDDITFEGVVVTKDHYQYYFCEKCCDAKLHCKPIIEPPNKIDKTQQ